MLKEKDLSKIMQNRYRNGENVNFSSIEEEIQMQADQYGIPVAFGREKIKTGGFGGAVTECMTLYHPQYQGRYNFYAFSISRQGTYAFVDIYMSGTSQMGTLNDIKDVITSGHFSSLSSYDKGSMIGYIAGSVISGNFFKGWKANESFEAEKHWYLMVNDILNELFGKSIG